MCGGILERAYVTLGTPTAKVGCACGYCVSSSLVVLSMVVPSMVHVQDACTHVSWLTCCKAACSLAVSIAALRSEGMLGRLQMQQQQGHPLQGCASELDAPRAKRLMYQQDPELIWPCSRPAGIWWAAYSLQSSPATRPFGRACRLLASFVQPASCTA